jgi:hypothetical protein
MRGMGLVRSSPATLVATVAFVVGVGGIALAASSGSPTITVCVHKHGGGLYKAKHCAKHDGHLSWNNVDPSQFYTKAASDARYLPVNTQQFYTKAQSDSRYVAAGTQLGVFAYGQIREDASIRSSSANVISAAGTPGFVEHPGTGEYCVDFSNSPPGPNEIEGSVVGHAGSSSNPVFPYVTNGQAAGFNCTQPNALQILIMDSAGTKVDARFSFIVP